MTKDLTDLQQGALEAIMARGSANPITGKEIANGIGLTPRDTGKEGADMRSIIHALRAKGYPVCASGGGYWWPASQEELKKYIESFQARIEDQQRACDSLELGFDKIGKTTERIIAEKKEYRYKADNKIFKVGGARVDDFLRLYPMAELID